MKYVIQTDREFDGCVYTSMPDDVHCNYSGETIEEIRAHNPSHTYEVVDGSTVDIMVDEYLIKLTSEPFKEITEEEYYDMIECVPTARQGRNWYFVGEAYNFDVHMFCFTDGERYYGARRRVTMSKEQINNEINQFLKSQKQ